MLIITGRRNRHSALRWLASVVGLGATALLVHACARGRLDQSVGRLESGDPNAPRAGTGNSATAKQTVVEREVSTTKRLHELGEREPATALGLALARNLQFPASADAPERGWILCRTLVELERFPEAVAVARLVVEQYPNTRWALDVQRHLLVNPMSDPSERGYGHQSELE